MIEESVDGLRGCVQHLSGDARPRGMRLGHHILDRLPRRKYDPRKKVGVNGEPLARANQGSSRTGTRRAGQCHCANVIEKAFQHLLQRHRFSRPDIRFWVVHPGGRKVMDDVQRHLGLTDGQIRFSRAVLRNYGNTSSPTVMFVLDEVVRNGDPRPGEWGIMVALGPGMAAEVALLRW